MCREQDKGDAEAHRVASDLGIVTKRVQAVLQGLSHLDEDTRIGEVGRLNRHDVDGLRRATR